MDDRSALNIPIAVFLIVGVAGLAVALFAGVMPALRKAAATDWQPVTCTITHTRGGERNYLNEFTYTYQGVTYHGDRYSFYRRWTNSRFLDGARVTGALDPRHPEDAVLRPDDVPPHVGVRGHGGLLHHAVDRRRAVLAIARAHPGGVRIAQGARRAERASLC